jgi:hypothetical protein
MKNKIILLGLLLFCASTVWAQKQKDVEIVVEYDETYTDIKGKQLILSNKYGKIDVYDWDKNEIKVHVEVITSAANRSKAEEIQKKIIIEFETDANTISVKTELDDMGRDVWDLIGNKYSFEINYKINMPANTPLDLSNKYGAVFINNLTSTSSIAVKYGSLKANKIIHGKEKPYTQIILGYSKANIEVCQWLKIYAKYSELDIVDSKALIMETKYSDFEIERATSIVTEAKYDDYKIGVIDNLVTETAYSDYKISKLNNKLVADSRYTDVYIKKIDADFKSINVVNKYGDYKLFIDENASYKIKAMAEYSDIDVPETGTIRIKKDGNEKRVSGFYGSENTDSQIVIDTKYGDFKLID